MSKANRWIPTEREINRLLSDTDSRRSELALVLRGQKVEIERENPKNRHKTVTRNVHIVYFNPETQHWTGQIHRNQTEWENVAFRTEDSKWYPVDSPRLTRGAQKGYRYPKDNQSPVRLIR